MKKELTDQELVDAVRREGFEAAREFIGYARNGGQPESFTRAAAMLIDVCNRILGTLDLNAETKDFFSEQAQMNNRTFGQELSIFLNTKARELGGGENA